MDGKVRTTKIVATLGPATDTPEKIRQLFDAGVDVFRLNASHGGPEQQKPRVEMVRHVAGEFGRYPSLLLDLQGPKIRLGTFENGKCEVETGDVFCITIEPVNGNCRRASTTYKDFVKDVKAGDRVLIADGSVELRVTDKTETDAVCQVVSGGEIGDRKGINLPGADLSISSLTKKDQADLQFAIEAGLDFVALSFVRKREDILKLRLLMEAADHTIPIVAKIEKPEAFRNLDDILREADGVMVARGDLGVEVALEKVPAMQKSIITKARKAGRFVITATQMLESMIDHPYPTRAEVSDVANAIYDGTDAIMLSAETSTGSYPVETVRMMSKIALETENSIRERGFRELPRADNQSYAEIIADMAYRAARQQNANAICVFTATGSTAKMVARMRPLVPIYAFTTTETVARRLSVVYGVQPVVVDNLRSTDEMMTFMDHVLLDKAHTKKGEGVVFIAGQPIGRPGSTNLMKLHRVGELR